MADTGSGGAFDAFGGGLARGVQMAQAAAQMQDQMAQAAQRRQQLEAQKLDLVYGDLQRAMTLPKPVQKFAFDKAQKTANALGVQLSPEFLALAQDPEQQQGLKAVLGHTMGLDDDPRYKTQVEGLTYLAGNNLEKLLPLMEQVAGNKGKQNELQNRLAQQQFENTTKVQQQTQEFVGQGNIQSVQAANKIMSLLAPQAAAKSSYVLRGAQELFAKLLDPTTGVREQELENVSGLATDFFDRLNKFANKQINALPMTAKEVAGLQKAVDMVGSRVQTDIDKTVSNQHQFLTGTVGLAPGEASKRLAFIPTYQGIQSASTLRARIEARGQALMKQYGMDQQTAAAQVQREFGNEIASYKRQQLKGVAANATESTATAATGSESAGPAGGTFTSPRATGGF